MSSPSKRIIGYLYQDYQFWTDSKRTYPTARTTINQKRSIERASVEILSPQARGPSTSSGFTLPVAMVYTDKPEVSAQVPGIAVSSASAQGFVSRLVMQAVFHVLENQARSALIPDAVISSILGQLEIKIIYEPLLCQKVVFKAEENRDQNTDSCIIISNTVTGICKKNAARMCIADMATEAVPDRHKAISGTLSTTNTIMANWSRMMWQSVLNRALRMLAPDPFGSHFFSATGTVGGN
ncbi:hypothetical protein KIN20_026810 [Parelaphostrongylus tenuis]|uniref:Uncharacterized protein n=1 Tax=Parelaphostrongylus tenuis TaxID=148309 RepID=A0AAD5QYH1_PARTN|nr:hypothetical protein KIN20_026810 [Parelaphostrongylus tenuis]